MVKKKFYFPSLQLNMRNSKCIGEAASDVKPENSTIDITADIIDKLPIQSTTNDIQPSLILVEKDNFKNDLSSVFKKATDLSNNGGFSILHDGSDLFHQDEIKQAVINCGVQNEDLLNHSVNTSKDDVEAYLCNPRGVQICRDKYYVGMESNVVIYCVSDTYDYTSLRCHMMRAVSNLIAIYAFDKNLERRINFGSTKMHSQYLQCQNTMEQYAWKCDTCKRRVVCKNCAVGCHRGHQLTLMKLDGQNKHCACDKTNKCICENN